MIVSNDSITNPPFDITPEILKLVASISEKLGEIKASLLIKPSPQLRKANRVKTISSTLAIEGNTLSQKQVTAVLEGKRVLAPQKDILEIENAIKTYERLSSFKPASLPSFLKAHKLLMAGLMKDAGKLRTGSVGIVKGNELKHLAPPANNLKALLNTLFEYLKKSNDHSLIKSCVIHYELAFIHPFSDGNGRMARLWQSVILSSFNPVFAYLPFENVIREDQEAYYSALEQSDKMGNSTVTIEFLLNAINESLAVFLNQQGNTKTAHDRIELFLEQHSTASFTRKEFMLMFKNISTATASRDLKLALDSKLIVKQGDKRNTVYQIRKV